MTNKAKHLRIRSTILQSAGMLPISGRRKANIITELDYAAVAPPLNLKAQPAGNCLIWLSNIDSDGYGTGSFSNGEYLAHRQAFVQSRGRHPSQSVLHLCHRPFCIQPSHLYDGSALDNSQDHKLRVLNGLDFDLFNEKADIVQSVARYQWASPRDATSQPLFIPSVEHDCEFIIPAMDRNICPTCGCDELSEDTFRHFEGAEQPDNTDRNAASILKRSRSFRNLPDGMTIESNITTEMSIPKTRAERRRRDRAAQKFSRDNKPIHLGSSIVPLKPGVPIEFNHQFEQPTVMGPGFIVCLARAIKEED